MATNNAINSTLATPFTVGATSVTSTGTQLNLLNGLTAVPINKVNTQTITATGAFTYTATAGTKYAIFELQGAGGGSGGTTGTAGQSACSGGAQAGGYFKILVIGTTNLAAITGSVGAAGAAGSSGNNAGGTGGNTTLTINSGTQWVAGGGTGSAGQTSSATNQISSTPGSGSTNTVGTNGTTVLNIMGTSGDYGLSFGVSNNFVLSKGGSATLGQGGGPINTAGTGYGGGGVGNQNGTGSNSAGNAGNQGVVVVTEFISA